MVPPGMGRFARSSTILTRSKFRKNALAKNIRPKLVALVGCVKRHIGKNKASPLPGTLLWQSN
jgi:hypothetical protein